MLYRLEYLRDVSYIRFEFEASSDSEAKEKAREEIYSKARITEGRVLVLRLRKIIVQEESLNIPMKDLDGYSVTCVKLKIRKFKQ